ncbi:DUF5712 family protein [Bacteroides salyersiae]|jgi:hypothetical protein|uniref:DUF5712 family protein n=1 Tax=Bacteroides salyersiae TaxID=291644 RepID=UPI00397B7CC1
MHIDFAPPSGGTYNNAGSSRQLVSYCEHEDLERMEKGIYTDGFFNLTEDNIYKSKVIKDIDSNIGQLLKTDAKFFAIHVSPSEKELQAMGNTEQEQAKSMKRYIREVFIPEYAKNFNKGLSEADIKFYGKIHFDRSRSDNELNMHCHLIVSRKDQANKKKLSPLTNHKNSKNGVIKGGFDRVNLFQQAEQGFDRLFGYNRQLSESFEYSNTMKNRSINDKLRMQEQELKEPKQYFTGENKKDVFQSSEKENNISCNLDSKADEKHSYNQQNNGSGDSLSYIFSLGESNNYDVTSAEELQAQKHKKKKKKGIRR